MVPKYFNQKRREIEEAIRQAEIANADESQSPYYDEAGMTKEDWDEYRPQDSEEDTD